MGHPVYLFGQNLDQASKKHFVRRDDIFHENKLTVSGVSNTLTRRATLRLQLVNNKTGKGKLNRLCLCWRIFKRVLFQC